MGLIVLFLQVVVYVVIADALLSWFQKPEQMPRKLTRQLTDPLYAPIHAIIDPRKTGLDLSPIVVIVLLQLIIGVLS
jgi:uncharacterized protein YggT (Ycf19 family)